MIIEKIANNDIKISDAAGNILQGFNPNDSIRLDPNSNTNILIYQNTGVSSPFNIFVPQSGRSFTLITQSATVSGIYTRNELYNALLTDFFFFPLVSSPPTANTNFANTDLELNAPRTHNFAGFPMDFTNGLYFNVTAFNSVKLESNEITVRGIQSLVLDGTTATDISAPDITMTAGNNIIIDSNNTSIKGTTTLKILTPELIAGQNKTGFELKCIDGLNGNSEWKQPNFLGAFNSVPTGIVFIQGMQYFDTTYNMLMNYDASRAKWLSAESITVTLSDSGQLPTGSFLQMGSILMVQNLTGINPLFAATVTGLTYTRQDSDAAIIELLTSGAAVNSLQIPLNAGVFKNRYTALNFDFNDVLTVRNAPAGSNNITNFIVQITYKFLGLSGI